MGRRLLRDFLVVIDFTSLLTGCPVEQLVCRRRCLLSRGVFGLVHLRVVVRQSEFLFFHLWRLVFAAFEAGFFFGVLAGVVTSSATEGNRNVIIQRRVAETSLHFVSVVTPVVGSVASFSQLLSIITHTHIHTIILRMTL